MLSEVKIIGANVSYRDYSSQTAKRGDKAYIIGQSDLKDILSCPHKWRYSEEEPDDDTEAMDWGTLIDGIICGQTEQFSVTPETYPAEGKKGAPPEDKPWNWNANYCKDWRDQQGDKIVVKSDVWDRAQDAVKVLRSNPQVAELYAEARMQIHLLGTWTDEPNTDLVIPVHGLIDVEPSGKLQKYWTCLADLKTTADASMRKWQGTVWGNGYHVQAAWYIDLFNAAVKKDLRNIFLHVIQEQKPPYEVATRLLDESYIQIGRAQYTKALDLYAQCLSTDTWPGYDEGSNQRIDGWTVTPVEPWMVMHSGVKLDNSDQI